MRPEPDQPSALSRKFYRERRGEERLSQNVSIHTFEVVQRRDDIVDSI